MKNRITIFKQKWQISKNWQLLYPILGVLGCIYIGYKIVAKIIDTPHWVSIVFGVALGLVFVKLCLFFINKLESKWVVKQRWELIRIFFVFAITGSSSVAVGRPLIKWIGISQSNFNSFFYWMVFVFANLIIYQILLIFWGYILGELNFFWNFEKKMLRRLGLGHFLNN